MYDIIVIGAGIAGTSAAAELALDDIRYDRLFDAINDSMMINMVLLLSVSLVF